MTRTRARIVLPLVAAVVALVAAISVPWTAHAATPSKTSGPDHAATSQASVSNVTALKRVIRAACDTTGRSPRACVRHALVGDAADGTLSTASNIQLRLRPHTALQGRALAGELQIRRVGAGGKAGAWHPHGRFDLASVKRAHTITTCAPKYAGTYQVRVVLHPGKTTKANAATKRRTSRLLPLDATTTTAPLTASAPTTLTVTQAPESCTSSDQDELLVEYFNELAFSNVIEAIATSTGSVSAGAWNVVISCPQAPSPDLPGPEFSLALIASDHSTTTTCASQAAVAVSANALPGYCQQVSGSTAVTCMFLVVFANTSTGTVYSQSEIALTLLPSPATTQQVLLPQLEPATLPICNITENPCLIDNSCTLSTNKQDPLSLCESSANCTAPTSPPTSTYGDSTPVDFDATVADPTT